MNGSILHSVKEIGFYAAAIGGIGAFVYTSRQVITKDDLKEMKEEVVERIDTLEDRTDKRTDRLEKRIDDLGSTLDKRIDDLGSSYTGQKD